MRSRIVILIGFMAALTGPAGAGTFAPASIAPDASIDMLTRRVARDRVGQSVFSDPYSSATLSHVDLYDAFPYVETRQFQVVSDPRWNRLVCGEMGRSLGAFDGAGTAVGPLRSPHGLSVDERDRVYVADTGNDRIVVLQATTEFDRIELVPLYTIEGLSGPFDVAYSDGGTAFQPDDDLLYVADSGRNRVGAYRLGAAGARLIGFVGDLGSGVGHFAGPTAIAVGRSDGVHTPDVFVADAHNHRFVHLRLEHGALRWIGESPAAPGVITSLDTDAWGNLYAAAPQQGTVRKYSPALEPVAELTGPIARPRSFRIPYATIQDHRDGSVRRVGQPAAYSVGEWSEASGMQRWDLGVGIERLGVSGGEAPSAHFVLTDQASLSLEVMDAASGRLLSRRSVGTLPAGSHELVLDPSDLAGVAAPTDLVLRVRAVSSYASAPAASADAGFRGQGSGLPATPSSAALLGNWPNPVQSSTRISFVLPASPGGRVALGVFDAHGRRVRQLAPGVHAGLNEVSWDGADDTGHPVRSGVYFYRLEVGTQRFTRRLAVVR